MRSITCFSYVANHFAYFYSIYNMFEKYFSCQCLAPQWSSLVLRITTQYQFQVLTKLNCGYDLTHLKVIIGWEFADVVIDDAEGCFLIHMVQQLMASLHYEICYLYQFYLISQVITKHLSLWLLFQIYYWDFSYFVNSAIIYNLEFEEPCLNR